LRIAGSISLYGTPTNLRRSSIFLRISLRNDRAAADRGIEGGFGASIEDMSVPLGKIGLPLDDLSLA
jgi:hypothetical protein